MSSSGSSGILNGHGQRRLAGFMVGGRLGGKQSSVVLKTLSMRLASLRAKPYRKPRERRSVDCQGCLHVNDGKWSRHSGIYARMTLNAKTPNRRSGRFWDSRKPE